MRRTKPDSQSAATEKPPVNSPANAEDCRKTNTN